MIKNYNCKTCLYANENCGVDCDKRLLLDGEMVHIEPDKVELDCVAHSDYKVEETRYDRPWSYVHEADDICQICARPLRISDKDTYEYVEVETESEDGKTRKTKVRKCKICIKKGR